MTRITNTATLNDRIRELIADDPDPSVTTEKILTGIDYIEARVIAGITLREHVRHIASQVAPIRERARTEAIYTTADGQETPIPHVAGVRDRWVTLKLMTIIQVSQRRYDYLRNATPDNLLWAVNSRQEKAAANLAEAARHQQAADELRARELSCVDKLPDDVITAIYRH
jgi:hypothetical protein